jgi:hypothetical protein
VDNKGFYQQAGSSQPLVGLLPGSTWELTHFQTRGKQPGSKQPGSKQPGSKQPAGSKHQRASSQAASNQAVSNQLASNQAESNSLAASKLSTKTVDPRGLDRDQTATGRQQRLRSRKWGFRDNPPVIGAVGLSAQRGEGGRGLLAKQARQIRRTAERKTKAYTAN